MVCQNNLIENHFLDKEVRNKGRHEWEKHTFKLDLQFEKCKPLSQFHSLTRLLYFNKSTPSTFVIICYYRQSFHLLSWTNKTFKKELHGLGKTKNPITNEINGLYWWTKLHDTKLGLILKYVLSCGRCWILSGFWHFKFNLITKSGFRRRN